MDKEDIFKEVFFVKLLGITFSGFSSKQYLRGTVLHISVPSRYKTLSFCISFLKMTPFQSCMAIQLSMTMDAAIRIALTLQRGELHPQQIALPPGDIPVLPDDNTQ